MTISFGALAAANRPLPIRAVTPTLLCTASRLMAVPIDQGATFHAGKGGAFLTAQIAGDEVVYSVILPHAEHPFDRTGVERHFACECPPISN